MARGRDYVWRPQPKDWEQRSGLGQLVPGWHKPRMERPASFSQFGFPQRKRRMPFVFYLGTPEVMWLERTSVPLFVSHNRLRKRKSLPRAKGWWCLDSGAYSQLRDHGRFLDSPLEYARLVRRYRDDIGNMIWASHQDWMIEVDALQKTGLSPAEHLRRTVWSFVEIKSLAPDLPWMPILQPPYARCIEEYLRAGVDLTSYPHVGVGSVCKRIWPDPDAEMWELHWLYELELHGFGVETEGLVCCKDFFVSTDSQAWSFAARRGDQHAASCTCTHDKCTNCLPWALEWREKLLRRIGEASQI